MNKCWLLSASDFNWRMRMNRSGALETVEYGTLRMVVPIWRDLGSQRWYMHTRFLIDAEERKKRTLKGAQKNAKDKFLIFQDLALGQLCVQIVLWQASWCGHCRSLSTFLPSASLGVQFPKEEEGSAKCRETGLHCTQCLYTKSA